MVINKTGQTPTHKALATRTGALLRPLFQLLDRKSLLGRVVIGHGDLHAGNLRQRSNGDVVFLDIDDVMLMPAAFDLLSSSPKIGTTRASERTLRRIFTALQRKNAVDNASRTRKTA